MKFEDLKSVEKLPKYGDRGQFWNRKEIRDVAIEISKYLYSKNISYEGLRIMFNIKKEEIRPLLPGEKLLVIKEDFI